MVDVICCFEVCVVDWFGLRDPGLSGCLVFGLIIGLVFDAIRW